MTHSLLFLLKRLIRLRIYRKAKRYGRQSSLLWFSNICVAVLLLKLNKVVQQFFTFPMLSFCDVENLPVLNMGVLQVPSNLMLSILTASKTYTYGFGSLQRCSAYFK